jgi:hypothetical protein
MIRRASRPSKGYLINAICALSSLSCGFRRGRSAHLRLIATRALEHFRLQVRLEILGLRNDVI